MNPLLPITAGLLVLSVLAVLVLFARSAAARITAATVCLGLAAFSTFGFLASFEPSTTSNLPWQVTYGIVGICALAAIPLLLRKGGRPSQGTMRSAH